MLVLCNVCMCAVGIIWNLACTAAGRIPTLPTPATGIKINFDRAYCRALIT